MNTRINEGYVITDSIQVGETEFVLGKLDHKIPMYVTWACKGGDNYYWGHYFSDPLEAKVDLLGRAGQELEYQIAFQHRPHNRPQETKEEHESR